MPKNDFSNQLLPVSGLKPGASGRSFPRERMLGWSLTKERENEEREEVKERRGPEQTKAWR